MDDNRKWKRLTRFYFTSYCDVLDSVLFLVWFVLLGKSFEGNVFHAKSPCRGQARVILVPIRGLGSGGSRGHRRRAPPKRSPVLSFSHFSAEKHPGERSVRPTGRHPPPPHNGKSWICSSLSLIAACAWMNCDDMAVSSTQAIVNHKLIQETK